MGDPLHAPATASAVPPTAQYIWRTARGRARARESVPPDSYGPDGSRRTHGSLAVVTRAKVHDSGTHSQVRPDPPAPSLLTPRPVAWVDKSRHRSDTAPRRTERSQKPRGIQQKRRGLPRLVRKKNMRRCRQHGCPLQRPQEGGRGLRAVGGGDGGGGRVAIRLALPPHQLLALLLTASSPDKCGKTGIRSSESSRSACYTIVRVVKGPFGRLPLLISTHWIAQLLTLLLERGEAWPAVFSC